MTETDLIDDLDRLRREGLIVVDCDQMDGYDEVSPIIPRFYVTPRGREQLSEPIDLQEDSQR